MRLLRLVPLLSCLVFLAAPGIGPSDGSGMRASNGGGNIGGPPPSGDPCNTGDAFLNYDARLVSGTDNVQETSWANAGSGGSAWDATTAVSGGLTYQQAGDCSQSPYPCLVSDATGADRIEMPADVSHVWNYHLICAVYTTPNSTSIQRSVQISGDVPSRNVFGSNGLYELIYVSGAQPSISIFPTSKTSILTIQCVDTTNPLALEYAIPGTEVTGVYNAYSSVRNSERISLGGRIDGNQPCLDCEIHQFIAWDEDPGLSALEMANCLSDEWSS